MIKSIKNLFSYKSFIIVTSAFLVFIIWRFLLIISSISNIDIHVQIWAASYQIVAWLGAIIGLIFSKSWGGRKSVIGRAAIAFSAGLLAQSFGQSIFSYYFYTGSQAPYPSLADVGFLGSIPMYCYGIVLLGKASGAHISLKSSINKIYAIVIPLIILLISYIVFLKDYEFTNFTIRTFLDFGYPLGQAFYISLAILAYFLSRNTLGGLMKKPVLFFIAALVFQYACDYTFLYQSSRNIFVGGGLVDMMYLISYFIMSLALVKLIIVFEKIKNS